MLMDWSVRYTATTEAVAMICCPGLRTLATLNDCELRWMGLTQLQAHWQSGQICCGCFPARPSGERST